MQYFDAASFADFCQACTIFFTLSAYVPQWLVLLKTKSSEQVALGAWILWLISNSLTFTYAGIIIALEDTAYLLLISTGFNILCIATTIVLILRYRKPAKVPDRFGPTHGIDDNDSAWTAAKAA